MAAALQTKAFMGQSLGQVAARRSAGRAPVQVQAFFKKAEKEVKKAAPKGTITQKAKSAAKTVQKKALKTASKAEPKEAKKAKSGGLFSAFTKKADKAATQVQKAAPAKPVQKAKREIKKVAPKKPVAQVKKAFTQVKRVQAPKPVRKAASAVKGAASGGGKGWLGGAGGPKGLDQWYGPSRALYLPRGLLDPADIPSYLNGSLAGDYGYDPLGLGKDPSQVETYRAYELIHARWAMLAAAGIIIPEGLQANGADIKGGTWFETGAEMLGGGTLNYFAVPWGIVNNPLPLAAIVVIEVALLGAVENYRRTQQGPPGYSPGVGKFESDIFNGLDNLYPGGPFDPLGLADDPETFQELKVKEIKNGRLALVSVLGFAVQAAVTGEGPYANWSKHVSDPFGYNLLTILGAEDRLPTL
eukprot:CAMPEP_0206137484 /NCGR_PEP_ID=MMETSP1473-20131121/2604_1 /ASSEMBLY_ACC=CAM_ASM_001109 /TAXON_ID=1461547 /ORGANISM="Stichococcus sp, Strain RCC1054" /LENGTH=413 /DNA_ID=CAMNT_0053530601 /DNA_START=60 /DNA_END=1301 /DNA_ORIENTATION=-